MKKVSKTLSLFALCAVMIIMSVLPAFASVACIENHNVVDCTNRYKDNDGTFYFTIKLPNDLRIGQTSLMLTSDYNGTEMYTKSLICYEKNLTYSYSDEKSDYYILKFDNVSGDGLGIKLFSYCNDGVCYTASDTANGSTVLGRGYWLSK